MFQKYTQTKQNNKTRINHSGSLYAYIFGMHFSLEHPLNTLGIVQAYLGIFFLFYFFLL